MDYVAPYHDVSSFDLDGVIDSDYDELDAEEFVEVE